MVKIEAVPGLTGGGDRAPFGLTVTRWNQSVTSGRRTERQWDPEWPATGRVND